MLKEFYFRDEQDPNYMPDVLEISNEIECLIYQIKMTIGTSRGDILGTTQFGANVEDMLFITNYNPEAWKYKIREQLEMYSLLAREYKITLNAVSYNDGYKDYGILDIGINGKSIMGFAFDNK